MRTCRTLKLSQYLGFFAVISAPVFFAGSAIMAAVVFLGGVQLIAIGILGEYIGRMYEESKGRPLYIIDKEININGEKEKELKDMLLSAISESKSGHGGTMLTWDKDQVYIQRR